MDEYETRRIFDYYKPRHTHSWNMLVNSWRELDELDEDPYDLFEFEYAWEYFIIRLWLYRVTVNTLTYLHEVKAEATVALKKFDHVFDQDGINTLRAIRNMFEHFDDYAANEGRGPAIRNTNLDPWRRISRDEFQRGTLTLDRTSAYKAACVLREDAKSVSKQFRNHFNSG